MDSTDFYINDLNRKNMGWTFQPTGMSGDKNRVFVHLNGDNDNTERSIYCDFFLCNILSTLYSN